MLAIPGPGNDLCIFDPDSRAFLEIDMVRKVCSLTFSPNYDTLVVGCKGGLLTFIDETMGVHEVNLGLDKSILDRDMAFLGSGALHF